MENYSESDAEKGSTFVLVLDMVRDIRLCGTLDIENGRLRSDVDNVMDFLLVLDWSTVMPR